MSWKRSRFASSLMSLWGEAAPVPSAESRIKLIRQAMLDSLADLGESPLLFCRRRLETPCRTYLQTGLALLLNRPEEAGPKCG